MTKKLQVNSSELFKNLFIYLISIKNVNYIIKQNKKQKYS